uniref:Uncharacterized protein C2orf50-like n=1 Tax=Phallusia mammillata TaxID=59560 RepID=A0A6F9D886_9ASCI|nr:uncharacterized protein C2orf50-like [Phallusia mammillata]
MHSDDDDVDVESDVDFEQPTPERASNGSEGSLMGEIFAYLKTNNDPVQESDSKTEQRNDLEEPATEDLEKVGTIPQTQVGAEESLSESSDGDALIDGKENAESRSVSDSESEESDDVLTPTAQTDPTAAGAKCFDLESNDSSHDYNDLSDVDNVAKPSTPQEPPSAEPVLSDGLLSVNNQDGLTEPEPDIEIEPATLTVSDLDKGEFSKSLSSVNDTDDATSNDEKKLG